MTASKAISIIADRPTTLQTINLTFYWTRKIKLQRAKVKLQTTKIKDQTPNSLSIRIDSRSTMSTFQLPALPGFFSGWITSLSSSARDQRSDYQLQTTLSSRSPPPYLLPHLSASVHSLASYKNHDSPITCSHLMYGHYFPLYPHMGAHKLKSGGFMMEISHKLAHRVQLTP